MKIIPFRKLIRVFVVLILALSCFLTAGEKKNRQKKNDSHFVAVIQKDGKKVNRKCFRDEDGNGYCDRGSEQKWKCPNNCRRADFAQAEKNDNPGARLREGGDNSEVKRKREGDQPAKSREYGDRPELKKNCDRPEQKKKNGGDQPKVTPSPEADGGWSQLPCSGCPLAGACHGKCISGLI